MTSVPLAIESNIFKLSFTDSDKIHPGASACAHTQRCVNVYLYNLFGRLESVSFNYQESFADPPQVPVPVPVQGLVH